MIFNSMTRPVAVLLLAYVAACQLSAALPTGVTAAEELSTQGQVARDVSQEQAAREHADMFEREAPVLPRMTDTDGTELAERDGKTDALAEALGQPKPGSHGEGEAEGGTLLPRYPPTYGYHPAYHPAYRRPVGYHHPYGMRPTRPTIVRTWRVHPVTGRLHATYRVHHL